MPMRRKAKETEEVEMRERRRAKRTAEETVKATKRSDTRRTSASSVRAITSAKKQRTAAVVRCDIAVAAVGKEAKKTSAEGSAQPKAAPTVTALASAVRTIAAKRAKSAVGKTATAAPTSAPTKRKTAVKVDGPAASPARKPKAAKKEAPSTAAKKTKDKAPGTDAKRKASVQRMTKSSATTAVVSASAVAATTATQKVPRSAPRSARAARSTAVEKTSKMASKTAKAATQAAGKSAQKKGVSSTAHLVISKAAGARTSAKQASKAALIGKGTRTNSSSGKPPRSMPDPSQAPAGYKRMSTAFLDDGMCHSINGLNLDQVIACRREIFRCYKSNIEAVQRLGMAEALQNRGFRHFKLRDIGRFDLEVEAFKTPEFDFLHGTRTPWYPLVEFLLGGDCQLAHCGVMLSMPGSKMQKWHSDGDHQAKKTHLPPHCLNVFIPLCDITRRNGGTEMVKGTHKLGHYDDANESTIILAKAGECVLFDFRLRHRGLGNEDSLPRPLLYLQYCIPSFVDANFSGARYLKLPMLPPPPKRTVRVDDDEEVEDWIDYAALHFKQLEQERKLTLATPSEGKSLREIRHEHRLLAANAPRYGGIPCYEGAPIIAIDAKVGFWYPAQIKRIVAGAQTKQIKVDLHYIGWSPRYDCRMPLDQDHIRIAPPDIFSAVQNGKGAFHKPQPVNPSKPLESLW